jgi:hypothetical protein
MLQLKMKNEHCSRIFSRIKRMINLPILTVYYIIIAYKAKKQTEGCYPLPYH